VDGPQSFKTESELLQRLVEYVRENHIRVESPDYLTTKLYSPQWRCLGEMYYFRLPHNGKVIALRDGDAKSYAFNPDGFAIQGV
jgi:hypothetical protein